MRYILQNDINSIPNLYFINIYELAYKCKEWAFNKGYIIDEKGYWLFILTSDGITDLYNDYGGILSYGLSIGLEYTFK